MDNQIKQRLYITSVAAALLWLLCMGIVILLQVQDIRALALTECLKDNFRNFEICYRKTNDEISPTLINYLSPFIPVSILLWISWVLKFKFQIEAQDTPTKLRKTVVFLAYFIGSLGVLIPFLIVFEKEVERLYAVSIHNLFLMPWLAISWISIPIFFKKLLDAENKFIEFKYLNKLNFCVAISPILAVILLIVRQEFKF